jgi:hypothetical protein
LGKDSSVFRLPGFKTEKKWALPIEIELLKVAPEKCKPEQCVECGPQLPKDQVKLFYFIYYRFFQRR